MTPVRVCASKSEAQLLEKKIERKIDPSLNRMVRKLPVEQNYLAPLDGTRRARRGERAPSWGAQSRARQRGTSQVWR